MLPQLAQRTNSEQKRAIAFAILGALINAGLAIGMSVSDAIFLARVGSEQLAQIYLLLPLVMAVYIPLQASLLRRFSVPTLLRCALVVMATLSFAFFFLATYWPHTALIYACKLSTAASYIALYTLFWNFTDSYFHIIDAKRYFPYIAVGSSAGAALGGSLIWLASSYAIEPTLLFVGWGIFSLLAVPYSLALTRKYVSLSFSTELPSDTTTHGLWAEARDLLRFMRESRFALALTGLLFVIMVATLFCEFQYLSIFAANYSEKDLTQLLGKLQLFAHAAATLIMLFLFSPLVRRLGVKNVALAQPLAYIATFILFLVEGGELAAVFGFFAFQTVLTGVDYNNTNLLMNALPEARKRELRTCIEGICEPLAQALAGALILVGLQQLSMQHISWIGLGLSTGCLVLALIVRQKYVPAVELNLRRSWIDLSRPEVAPVPLAELLTALERQPTREERLVLLELLTLSYPTEAYARVLPELTALCRSNEAQALRLLRALLRSCDAEGTAALFSWLSVEGPQLSANVLLELARHGLLSAAVAEQLAASNDPTLRALAHGVLAAAADCKLAQQSLAEVTALAQLQIDDLTHALHGLAHPGTAPINSSLLQLLWHSERSVRCAALAALRHSLHEPLPDLRAGIQNLREMYPRDGLCDAIALAASLSDQELLLDCLRYAAFFGAQEQQAALDALTALGLHAVPTMVRILGDRSFEPGAHEIAARALALLSPAQLRALSSPLLERSRIKILKRLEQLERLESFALPNSVAFLLRKGVAEDIDNQIELSLRILSLQGLIPNADLLLASLASSNQKECANAIESVSEAGLKALAQLLHRHCLNPHLREQRSSAYEPGADRLVLHELLIDDTAVLRLLAAYVLWEYCAEEVTDVLQEQLQRERQPILAAEILLLLTRSLTLADATHPEEPRAGLDESSLPSLSERMLALATHPLLEQCPITQLFVCAREAKCCLHSKSQRPAPNHSKSMLQPISAPSSAGTSARRGVLMVAPEPEQASAEADFNLSLSISEIHALAGQHFALALSMLKREYQEAHV
jgi:hypothetical protein